MSKLSPHFFECAHFLSTDLLRSTSHLEYVEEAFDNNTYIKELEMISTLETNGVPMNKFAKIYFATGLVRVRGEDVAAYKLTMLRRFQAMNKVKDHPALPQSDSPRGPVESVQRGYSMALCNEM
jgi:hypothetical protein